MARTAKEYLNEEMRLYSEARSEWTAKRDAREALKMSINNLQGNRDYKPAILHQKLNEAHDAYRAATSDMLNVSEKLRKDFKALREEMYEGLYSKLHATPEQIDNNALALLNSGVLTAEELMKMGQDYRLNPAMRRIIVKEMDKRAENDMSINRETAGRLKIAADELRADTCKELEAFDSIADISYKAVGCPRDSRTDYSDTADAMAKLLEDNAQQIIDEATA